MKLKIASWAQLIFWVVLLLSGIGVSFLMLPGTDGWGLAALQLLCGCFVLISSGGVFISALGTLTARSMTYQPSYNEMTAFDRSLKFVSATGWVIFVVSFLLLFVVLGDAWLLIAPPLWIVCAILCDVLLIISKVKEKKRQTNA